MLPDAPAILSLSGIQLLAWFAYQAADANIMGSGCGSTPVMRYIFCRACTPFLR